MAVVRKYDATLPKVQVQKELRDRLNRVADDPRVQCSLATVIRDCIEGALPSIELQLGFIELEELLDEEDPQQPFDPFAEPAPKKEDRSVGCYGGPSLPE